MSESQTPSLKMVVGLGNPGHEYIHTRHNIGWRILDAMNLDFRFDKALQANIAKTRDCVYVQPTTFMNCSGEAVSAVARYFRIDPSNIIVVYDDKDIPFGTIRLRSTGSSAGHNGVQSVIQHLKTADFARVRIGVQNEDDNKPRDTADFVLSNFTAKEEQRIPHIMESAIGSIVYILDNALSVKDHKDLTVEEE